MSPLTILLLAFLSGFLPAIFWLSFWLKEDIHPEPRWLIMLTFFFGMLAVPAVIPFEKSLFKVLGTGPLLIIGWAFIEEVFKFVAASIALRRKEADEPMDPIIYLITAALGFAAIENTLFLFNPLLNEGFIGAMITGNMRFIGATILHTVSSGFIGLLLGLSFYRNTKKKKTYFFAGFFGATALHAIFNFLIIQGKGETVIGVFAGVWILAIALILMLEVVKKIKKPLNKI